MSLGMVRDIYHACARWYSDVVPNVIDNECSNDEFDKESMLRDSKYCCTLKCYRDIARRQLTWLAYD